MENPEGKFGFGFSRIRNGKQQLSGLFLDEDVYSSSAAEPGKLLQSHGAGAEPFHFVMRCQRRRNKRERDESSSQWRCQDPARISGRALPLFPFGGIWLRKSRFCRSSCEPRGGFRWGAAGLDQPSPDWDGDAAGCCISCQPECKLQPARTDPAWDVGAAIPESFHQTGVRDAQLGFCFSRCLWH